jgi:septum formation protein
MKRLVLASTSRYRSELLARLGVPFSARAPLCDEEALKLAGEEPAHMARRLAQAKALSLRDSEPDSYLLGGDQLVDFAGEVLGKPGSIEEAVRQLLAMQGKSHRLLTAICLVCPDGQLLSHLDVHTLTMAALSEQAVRRYVAADQPIDCAGSYKIEARGIALFSRIEGADFTAITGLPLMALSGLLRAQGFAVP